MKKEYISPEILVQKIELQRMIASSPDPLYMYDHDADESEDVL